MISLLLPWVFLVLLLALMVCLYKKKWIAVGGLSVVILLLNWYGEIFSLGILTHYDDEPQSITVMCWNIHGAGDDFAERAIGISDRIMTIDPDVVYLTEDFDGGREVIDSLLKEVYPYSNITTNEMGNVVYSKFPIDTVIHIKPETASPCFIFDSRLKVDDRTVSVFCCHLSSNNYNAANDYLTPDQVNSRSGIRQYYESLAYGFNSRKIEAKSVDDAIDRTLPTVVMGDMNEPSGANLKRLHFLKDTW